MAKKKEKEGSNSGESTTKSSTKTSKESIVKLKVREKEPSSGSSRTQPQGPSSKENTATKTDDKKRTSKEVILPRPKNSKENDKKEQISTGVTSNNQQKTSNENIKKNDDEKHSTSTRSKTSTRGLGSIVNKTVENSDRLQVSDIPAERTVHKVVLTGGPCGGKTTGQSRLAAFFQKHGWKVFCVPEAATILLGGGVQFAELNASQAKRFQKDLLLTLLQLEKVYFKQAKMISDKNVLIICDRGAMDPSAYVSMPQWQEILKELKLKTCDLREGRYHQIVHMVTAADGAHEYYTLANNLARSESTNEAIDADRRSRKVWVGHPHIDIIENIDCQNFEDKIRKMIGAVAVRVGLDSDGTICKNSKKRKWLVKSIDESAFASFEKFNVVIDILLTETSDLQIRLRRRYQTPDYSTYSIMTRHYGKPEQFETRADLSAKQYQRHLTTKDPTRVTLHKTRRCFLHNGQYFQLDNYEEPLPPLAKGKPLRILEAYTTKAAGDVLPELPKFIEIVREVTKEDGYSMFALAKIDSVTEKKSVGE